MHHLQDDLYLCADIHRRGSQAGGLNLEDQAPLQYELCRPTWDASREPPIPRAVNLDPEAFFKPCYGL